MSINKIKLNISYEDLKKLFEKYDYFTLDSFSLLLENVKKYDLTSTISALNFIKQEKYDSISSELEGMNEYDYICRINNFNLSEIKASMDSLNYKELIYLYDIALDALNNMQNENTLIVKIEADIEEFKRLCVNNLKPKAGDFTDDELEAFLNKYSISELNALNIIFGYVNDYNIERLLQIGQKVYQEKEKASSHDEQNGFNILGIIAKNKSLSDKELNYLYNLVENASLYLGSIEELEYAYKQVIADFDICDYPISEIYKLEETLYDEIDKRKNPDNHSSFNTKTYTKQKNPN